MPKEKQIDIGRLCEAMVKGRWALRRFREEKREAVRQYIGNHWSDEGTTEKVPVNVLAQYVRIVSRNLIAKSPRVMISSFDQQLKPICSAMESWANNEIENIDLATTLQRNVVDALFSIGITKVALADPADAATRGWGIAAGKPYAETVSLDDFVFDPHAKDFRDVTFIGHRYRVPLDVVKDSKIYGKMRKKLEPTYDNPYNLEGDERTKIFGQTYYASQDREFEDHIDLWEVYLPRHKVILTLPHDYISSWSAGNYAEDALRVQKWLGPSWGPYSILSMGTVPDNAMPKSPIQDLMDMHMLVNNCYRKLGRQSQREKEVIMVGQGRMEDGKRLAESSDGEIIQVNDPEKIVPTNFGGPNQSIFLIAQHFKDIFSWMGGNLDMMGGLSPQSKTLGQDQLLAQGATAGVADLGATTIKHTQKVLRSLCWYWWHDPMQVMTTNYTRPGMPDYSIVRRVLPQMRQMVPYENLDIRIDPYSMQPATPQSQAAALDQIVTQVIIPLLPLVQQQNISFDMNNYLTLRAKLMDMPHMNEILTTFEPPQMDTESSQAPQGPGMPAQTTRNYVRTSQGQGSQANRENAASNLAQTSDWSQPVGAS